MRALIQRVSRAKVTVDGRVVGEIGPGLLTFLGIKSGDGEPQARWILEKISKLRVFEDSAGKMNLSLADVKGQHLLVSQFTLYGDAKKGNRPSFVEAAPPNEARTLYERALEISRELGMATEAGEFQAHMKVELENDGPVTLWLESPV